MCELSEVSDCELLRNLRSIDQFVVIVLVGNDWSLIYDWSCY